MTTRTRHGFVMYLNAGAEAEYRRRHDALWPELAELLRVAGISSYSIFLDRKTGRLFAYQEREAGFDGEALARDPVMRRWWEHMKDLMRTDAEGRPVAEPLPEMFHLP